MPREEIIRRNAPSIALLEAQLANAVEATPEEIAQAESDWEAQKRSLKESRRANQHLVRTDREPPIKIAALENTKPAFAG